MNSRSQVCWSADSRLLVSSSKDSTLKVWDLKTKKIKFDLPGHADEVYAVCMHLSNSRQSCVLLLFAAAPFALLYF